MLRGRAQEVWEAWRRVHKHSLHFLCDTGYSVTSCYGSLLPHLPCHDGLVSQNHLKLMLSGILLLQEKNK